MRYEQLGSAPRVSRVGQGSWYVEQADWPQSMAAFQAGLDAGMNHIDTAEMYGDGQAETLIGQALQGRRHEAFLVSKVLPFNASRQGVIRACEASLKRLGIRTIGDLAKTDPELLKYHVKKHGEVIWNFANVRDAGVIETEETENKNYGNSTTIPFDVTDEGTARIVLLSLAETVGRRLRAGHVKAEGISVTIKNTDLHSVSHQAVFETPTNITEEVYRAACRLFEELWDGSAIRLLGISTSRIKEEGCARQMNIFEGEKYEKLERLDHAVDEIRSKFGSGAVMRASFLEQPVAHMAGREVRAEKKLDYKDIEIE